MKKKSMFLYVLAVCFIGMQAADVTTVWTNNLTLPREWNDAAGNDLAAISPTNETYVAGVFKGELEFAGNLLESEFNSTYLLKYNADGSEAWVVSFTGAITPTAITVGSDGHVYVAGTLADEVTMGTTQGETQVIDGIQDGGEYIIEQAAAFVAQYSADGNLQKVKTYKPSKDAEDWFSAYGYDVFMNISKLQFVDNKLYAGLVVGGDYTSVNDINVSGGSFFSEGFFMDLLTRSGYVVSLDEALEFDAVVTKLALHPDMTYQANVFNTAFTIEGNNLFVVYTTMGKQVLTVGAQTEDITLTMIPEGEDMLYSKGYLIANIDLSAKTLSNKAVYENKPISAAQASSRISTAKSIDAANEKLVITGAFQNELPFNNDIVAVKDTNIFVSALKISDLTVEAAQSSNYSGEEFWLSSAVFGDSVYVSANDTASKAGNMYILDLKNASGSLTESSLENTYVNALASRGSRMVQVEASLEADETATLRISMLNVEPDESSVGEVIDHELTFYPNPVKNTLYVNKASDIVIYNLSGVIVAQAANATQINLETLTSGSYIVAARNSDGVQRLPFVKE